MIISTTARRTSGARISHLVEEKYICILFSAIITALTPTAMSNDSWQAMRMKQITGI
jgi:hypothetical protein